MMEDTTTSGFSYSTGGQVTIFRVHHQYRNADFKVRARQAFFKNSVINLK
jgi:hypothetical protein